jgi:hypothetical protein
VLKAVIISVMIGPPSSKSPTRLDQGCGCVEPKNSQVVPDD